MQYSYQEERTCLMNETNFKPKIGRMNGKIRCIWLLAESNEGCDDKDIKKILDIKILKSERTAHIGKNNMIYQPSYSNEKRKTENQFETNSQINEFKVNG